jgi:hypothetical protein
LAVEQHTVTMTLHFARRPLSGAKRSVVQVVTQVVSMPWSTGILKQPAHANKGKSVSLSDFNMCLSIIELQNAILVRIIMVFQIHN